MSRCAWILVGSALAVVASGCTKKLSSEGVTWLAAVERELDHGVNLAIGVCKPDRADATAGRAQATATGVRGLLDDQLACVSADDCGAKAVVAKAVELESRLDDQGRTYAVASREAFSRLLGAGGTTKKTRAQAAEVLSGAIATTSASENLVRVCGSPSRRYDMAQTMLELEQARARFRASIKAMRADP